MSDKVIMNIGTLGLEHEWELASFVDEFTASGEDRIPALLLDPDWSFAEIVEGFEKQSRGEGLPEGWVPCTTRFLFQEGHMLGLFNLRHWLTEGLLLFGGHIGYSVRPSERGKGLGTRLLEAAVDMAREMDIERVLVTCDPKNVASARVIAKCGGILADQIFHEPVGHEVSRYWISLV